MQEPPFENNAAETLRSEIATVETNNLFSEAVLHLRDQSRLCFCHRVDERWAKAVGPEGKEKQGGRAASLRAKAGVARVHGGGGMHGGVCTVRVCVWTCREVGMQRGARRKAYAWRVCSWTCRQARCNASVRAMQRPCL